MKATELCAKNNISYAKFVEYLNMHKLCYTENFWGDKIIDDRLAEQYVNAFLSEKNISNEEMAQLAAEREQIEAVKRKAMAEMLVTSGFNFDGYKITKYSGYISGDDAISVDRGVSFLGIGGDSARDELMASLAKIRRNALRELKEAAYDLGCNAVVGVDFDYITLDPQTHNIGGGTKLQPYVFGVTANGNAVIIEKIED